MNRQPSLFDAPKKPDEPRQINLEGLRAHCRNRVYRLGRAEFLPWTGFFLKKEIKDFHYYGSHLPPEEFAELLADFNTEMARCKLAHIERFGELSPEDAAQLAA